MKKTSVGVGTAVAGAVLCALALAGCQGNSGSASGGSSSVNGAEVAATSSVTNGGGTSQGSTTAGGSNSGDGELSTVNQQLGTAGSDLAQATQSPSDGG
jgi:hypothetical protein